MSEKKTSGLNRRNVLKMAGASASVLGMGSVASAKGDSKATNTMAPEFRDPARVRDAIEAEAMPVLEHLVEGGYLDEASVDELPYSSKHPTPSAIEPADTREGVAASTFTRDGVESTVVAVSKNVEGGTMTLYVRPDGETTKARLSLDDGTEKLVDETRGEVTIQGCGTSSYCTDTVCDTITSGLCQVRYYDKIREECCQIPGGGSDCTVQGTTCECAETVGLC